LQKTGYRSEKMRATDDRNSRGSDGSVLSGRKNEN
jgi:hypothetical protein